MKHSLINHNCDVFYDEEKKEISGHDLTDQYNDQKFYSTKNKRFEKGVATT